MIGIATRGYWRGLPPIESGFKASVAGTTTFALIRQKMTEVIGDLTPITHADALFRLTENPMPDFRTYAEENTTSVFREYEITGGSTPLIGGSDHRSVIHTTACEVVIAYPHMWGEYAVEQTTTVTDDQEARKAAALMHSMAERDMKQVIKAIGIHGSANYLAGQRAAVEEEWEVELSDDISFGRISFEVEYEYDVS